jgi:hypothetical protein
MRLERSAITVGVTFSLLAVVLGVAIASADPARAYVDSPSLSESEGSGARPILRATAPRAPARPATLSDGSDDQVGLQKQRVSSGHYLPLPATGPESLEGFSNGDFESGPYVAWLEYSTHGLPLILHKTVLRDGFILPAHVTPRSGYQAAWLGGVPDEISYVRQEVDIPASRVTLGLWMWIESVDVCGYDFGGVVFHDDTVADVFPLCADWNTGGWVKREVQFSTCSARTFAFQIRAETDDSLNSHLYIDDVTLDVEPIECTSLYLPLVIRETAGPDPYAPPCDASNSYCEPYDSCPSAYGPLKPGRAYSAYPDDRNDYYYLELSNAGSVAIQVIDYFEDGQLVLRDPNDLEHPLGSDYETPSGDGEMNVNRLSLPAGRYCVQVYTADGHYQSSTRYTLTLSY